MVLHFQKRNNDKRLYKILQSRVIYGDGKECMDDKLSVQKVLIIFQKKYYRWHFIIQLSFIDYGWA
jgi:hypothetical protein